MTTRTESPPTAPPACWVCGASAGLLFRESSIDRDLRPEDMRITDARYGTTVRLFRCTACDFVYADMQQVRALVGLYEKLEDPDYEATAETRALQMGKVLDGVLRARPNARTLLDIGAGIGLLVHEASRRGLRAEGIEPSEWSVNAGRRRLDAVLHCGIFPHPATDGRLFDVITLVDVIEHVDDPVGLLRSIGRQLAPDGVAVIVTPDVSSLAARLFGRRWWHYRLAHVGFFNTQSLARALAAAGLKPVERRRARWYFPSGYLAERLSVYLPPMKLVNRWLGRTWLYRVSVPLNLHDSWQYLVARDEQC